MLAAKGEQFEQSPAALGDPLRLPPKARSAVRHSKLPCRSEFLLLLRPGAIDEPLEFMQITADQGVGRCRRDDPV